MVEYGMDSGRSLVTARSSHRHANAGCGLRKKNFIVSNEKLYGLLPATNWLEQLMIIGFDAEWYVQVL